MGEESVESAFNPLVFLAEKIGSTLYAERPSIEVRAFNSVGFETLPANSVCYVAFESLLFFGLQYGSILHLQRNQLRPFECQSTDQP